MSVYITGDTHKDFTRIHSLTRLKNTSLSDTIIILGDAEINFYGGKKDARLKYQLSKLPITLFCIHGNHEVRPQTISSYVQREWNGGMVLYEPAYPNILFAIDGEVYYINGLNCLVIGGAYSVDKYHRLNKGLSWWADEQPSQETKDKVEDVLRSRKVDVILTHTCPYDTRPTHLFLDGIDQSTVDNSTEKWLQFIANTIEFDKWYFGHFHGDWENGKYHMLYKNIIELK